MPANLLTITETIGFWILPGVLARVPELKIVLVEPSLGWVPFYLDLLDSFAEGPYDFPALDEKPSFYFHRQMYLTFVDDPRGLEHRHDLGVDRIMWSTDFPHPATSWPNSQAIVAPPHFSMPSHSRRARGSKSLLMAMRSSTTPAI